MKRLYTRLTRPLVRDGLTLDVGARMTAHEILHTFGLVHDAPIMCAKINIQNDAVGGTITPDHVKQLRSVASAARWSCASRTTTSCASPRRRITT